MPGNGDIGVLVGGAIDSQTVYIGKDIFGSNGSSLFCPALRRFWTVKLRRIGAPGPPADRY